MDLPDLSSLVVHWAHQDLEHLLYLQSHIRPLVQVAQVNLDHPSVQ